MTYPPAPWNLKGYAVQTLQKKAEGRGQKAEGKKY